MYSQESAVKYSQGPGLETRETNASREAIAVDISPRLVATVVRFREQTWCHISETNKRSKTISLTPSDLRSFFGKEFALRTACRRAAATEQKRNISEVDAKENGDPKRKRLKKASGIVPGQERVRHKHGGRGGDDSSSEDSAGIPAGWN